MKHDEKETRFTFINKEILSVMNLCEPFSKS
jgi:hypothetical protein